MKMGPFKSDVLLYFIKSYFFQIHDCTSNVAEIRISKCYIIKHLLYLVK